MSKFDSFNKDINELTLLESQIKTVIEERVKLIEAKKSTNKVDVILKGRLEVTNTGSFLISFRHSITIC